MIFPTVLEEAIPAESAIFLAQAITLPQLLYKVGSKSNNNYCLRDVQLMMKQQCSSIQLVFYTSAVHNYGSDNGRQN